MTARQIVKALRGRWHGAYGTARCPNHDDRTPSLSVSESQEGRLLVRCHPGCPQEAVWETLRGTRAKGFGDISVELDAIEPDRLRKLVRASFERHLPQDKLRILKVAEESERDLLHAWADDWEAA